MKKDDNELEFDPKQIPLPDHNIEMVSPEDILPEIEERIEMFLKMTQEFLSIAESE